MNRRLHEVSQALHDYVFGKIDRPRFLEDLQSVGYSEQVAIFVLELLEDVELILEVDDPLASVPASELRGETRIPNVKA